ncbi:hypothetical protein CORC01_00077 [Colletotrichum orchidophilum]|uniref:Uncharacterized protein n=1 Tax=Colletotrichum orchidophilum TaxID=1209926 RepID=A0A1G4BTF2_9PEZI|nr:uncharacterized protein CORC01_00077 [Colletotrichum orchidophilum]OHF04606.1 hypothetical protein CORC01_00077 [Colletotrichum orchidophilum]
MKFAAAILAFPSVVLAAEVTCCAVGDESSINKGDIEYAIKNRATELGIPGGAHYTYRWTTCVNEDAISRPAAVISTPYCKFRMSFFS